MLYIILRTYCIFVLLAIEQIHVRKSWKRIPVNNTIKERAEFALNAHVAKSKLVMLADNLLML